MESESHRLVHSLTAHLALYHSHVSNPKPNRTQRDSILCWFSSLSSAHRQAALSVADSSFIQIVLQMQSRQRRHGHSHFLLLPDLLSSSHPSLPSISFRPSSGLLSRSAASNSSALFLFNSILFFSSASCATASADALTVSESLVTDVDHFVGVMDGISGGRFLCEEVQMTGLTLQWVELPWLKDMGYYTLEAFLANQLEVVLRLAWFSSQGGNKAKEKRLKERAAKVSGKAANVFWRMKGCLGWWVGLDAGIRKLVFSAFLGKAAKDLACEIVKEEDVTLENRFGFLDTGRNTELRYDDLAFWKKSKRSHFSKDAYFDLDFLSCRVSNKLAIIWNKLVVVQDISNMLLAWKSSKSEAEKLFFGSLGSLFTVSDRIMRKLQSLLMVVYTNFINYELMDDTKLNIYPEKKAEAKSNLVSRKGKSKSRSSKKSNAMLKPSNTTMSQERKKLDCSAEILTKESMSSMVATRIIDGIVSLDINNVPEMKLVAAQEEMDNVNAAVSNSSKENNGNRKNRRKGSKNRCTNLKNIGKPKHEEKEAFLSIAAEGELVETTAYMCTSNSQPKSADVSTGDSLCAPSISDVTQECGMVDVLQSRQYQSLSFTGGRSTTDEKCHPNKQIDNRIGPIDDTSPHTCELDTVDTDDKQECPISRVARGTASQSSVSNECLHTATDDRRSVIHNGVRECYTYGGTDSVGGTSYEWPSITPLHVPSINSHLLPATDRLHLDVGVRLPYHNPQSFMSSKTHVGSSLSESTHSQILPSFSYPLSYDWHTTVKNCSLLSRTQTVSYESAYSQSLQSSAYSRLASCAANGVQVNVASVDNEVKHAGDIIDVFDVKNISDLVEDESYWLSEDETEPHAKSGRDYNKYFGGGVMYWNPTELVGIGFSRPPSHSSEDGSWAWHEADLNRTIDDMVGCKPGLPTYGTNGRASPPSFSSAFDNLTSGHQSLGYVVAGNDASSTSVHSVPLSYPSDEKISSSTDNSTACIEVVKGDPSPYPILRPIIIPGMSRKGSRSDLKLVHDNKSPCLSSARRDNPRIKRPPSPVVLCVPRVPRPPLCNAGESRKRGFPIVRSGSSSPRHWGVKNWCHEESIVADTHFCLDGAEVVWPAWARKGLGVTAVAQSLQGSLLQDHLITISQLAREQEHPDLALPIQPPDRLIGAWKGSLSMMHNLLHEEIDFFCKQVATKNLIRKPYINWAVKRVTRSLQVLWPRSRTNIFGSNATGLALPSSDVDLVVSLPPVRNLEPIKEAGILEGRNGIKETCLQHATRYLANQEWVRNDSLKTIENTAIPLIMLVADVPCDITQSHGSSSLVDIPKEKSSRMYGEHTSVSLLNLSDLENVISSFTSKVTTDGAAVGSKSVHLDISFKSTSHTGLQTSELVRELTQQFPASVPLALVLKKFLADRNLDHSYSGGLSSYCLVLLITRFLQHEHHCGHSMKQNLGSLLMDFLYFFGNVFDPRHMRISIQGSGVYMKRERGHSIDPIHIDDPLFPTNNVGRNCFRIHQCIKAFADAFATLENELPLISDETAPTSTQSFKLLRKIVPSIDCDE